MKSLIQLSLATLALVLLSLVVWRTQINGWPSLLWVTTVILMIVIRAPFAKRTSSNQITDKQDVTKERWLLTLVAIGGTYLPLLHLAFGIFGFANYRIGSTTAIAGGIILGPALWLFWRSHFDLGTNWSVPTELHQEQELVVSGVYKRSRLPMYAAIWLLFLVQPLFVHNWIAGFSGVIAFAIMYFIRVPYEEEMMRQRFGSPYTEYCHRAGRRWPKL